MLVEATLSASEDNTLVNDNGTLVQYTLEKFTIDPDKPIFFRDGALNLEIKNGAVDADPKLTNRYGRFRLVLQLAKAQRPFFLWQWHPGIDKEDRIELAYSIEDFSLPVAKIQAAGQDLSSRDRLLAPGSLGTSVEGFGERGNPPLVIPLNPENNNSSNYFLTFSESVNIGQDYKIDIKLQEVDPTIEVSLGSAKDKSTVIKAIVIDTNPQLTALVNGRFLQQPGFDDGAWVLARRSPFSNANGGWELLDDKADTEGFQIILPSQSIGEAYVKGKHEDPEPIPDAEPQEDKAIEYRFGAPAILRISPGRLEQRYVSPPWNLRHIWGQPGDEAPGVPLHAAQFELLYGLMAILKPDKTFIAELASKLGEVPVPPANSIAWPATEEQNKTFSNVWLEYLRFYRAWKSRVAILEPSREDAFTNTTFKEGISFRPRIDFKAVVDRNNEFERVGASLKYPFQDAVPEIGDYIKAYNAFNGVVEEVEKIEDENINKQFDKLKVLVFEERKNVEVIGTKFDALLKTLETNNAVKAIGKLEEWKGKLTVFINLSKKTISQSDLLDPIKKMLAAHDPIGLAGGFHYGFEAESVYKELWREALNKGSSSGEVKELAFSSVGGWGNQTARFAADKTVIKSITAMGRTHFYAVERIGRIGVFWNKAKHVIEYERTVVPSEQFMKDQPPHLGRPLVRKAREYIEILEPSRKYPDFPTDVQDSPGSVTRSTFKSIIIPVKSAWGRDVIDENKEYTGWEVPLWKPGADAKIYPKPQIILSVLAAPEADEKEVLHNLSEPHNLWFYTDTREFVIIDGVRIDITADVHKWPSIHEVDFTNLPEPEQYNIEPAAGDTPELLAQRLPDVLDIIPGFERFTFRVDRNEIPSSVAGRYYPDAALTGRMQTVSMMRSFYKKTKEEREEWWKSTDKNKVVLKSLIDGDNSLIARFGNGFKNLNAEIQNGAIPPINRFYESINRELISDEIREKLGEIAAISDVSRPQLRYFPDLWEEGKDFEYPIKWLWRESLESSEGLINNLMGFYDEQERGFIKELIELEKLSSQGVDAAHVILKRFQERVMVFRNDLQLEIEFLNEILNKIAGDIKNINTTIKENGKNVNEELQKKIDEINAEEAVSDAKEKIKVFVLESAEQLKVLVQGIDFPLKKVSDKIKSSIVEKINLSSIKFIAEVDEFDVNSSLESLKKEIKDLISTNLSDFTDLLLFREEDIQQATKEVLALQEFNMQVILIWDSVWKAFEDRTDEIIEEWKKNTSIVITSVKEAFKKIRDKLLSDALDQFRNVLHFGIGQQKISVFTILSALDEIVKSIIDRFQKSLIKFFSDTAEVEKWLDKLNSVENLRKAIGSGDKNKIIEASTSLASEINQEFGRLAGEVAQKVRDVERLSNDANLLIQTGKQTLTNFRSVWEEFTAPGMGLNRNTVAMIVKTDWKDIEQRLSITPVIARVKQIENDLEGLGLRLPVTAITDRILSAKKEWVDAGQDSVKALLSNYDFSSLFSDLGGMRFDGLFPGLKMPEFARDNIKVTHSFDKKNLSAWIKAEADIKFTDRKKLMSIGPVEVELEKGVFSGEISLQGSLEGQMSRTNSGRLSGSWHLKIGGTSLMIFRDTSVIFQNDKLTFDLDPKRMEMPGLLKMLTDATTRLAETGAVNNTDENGNKKDVFTVGLLKVREVPVGVRAELNIPPINIGGGTTAITNLCFGGHFELKALNESLKPDFLLGLGFYVGRRETPFNITIFILGGGGYVFCNLTFKPKEGLTVSFVLSIFVSASLAISLGWINGLVVIMLGLEGEYHKTFKEGSGFYITFYFRILGRVEILSVVTVFLFMGLEASYRSLSNGDSELIGTGFVQLEIRICRFFKIKVSRSFSKTFAGPKSKSAQSASPALAAAAVAAMPLPLTTKQKAQKILKSLD